METIEENANTCKYCPYQTQISSVLALHEKLHLKKCNYNEFDCSNLKPYECCGFEFETLIACHIHAKTSHSKIIKKPNLPILVDILKGYSCFKCKFTTWSKLVQLKNSSVAFLKGKRKNPLCSRCEDRLKSDLSKEKKWMCDICWQNFRSKKLLTTHKLKTHSPKVFKKKSNLTKHPKFQCTRCPFKCRTRSTLKAHTSTCQKWHKCDQCYSKFKTHRSLLHHVKMKHSALSKTKGRVCQYCGKETKTPYSLKVHVLVKHICAEDVQWHQCEHCDHKATTSGLLTWHVQKRHPAPKKVEWYHCEHCDYKTACKSSWQVHVRRKYCTSNWLHCDQCDYKAKQERSLQRHSSKCHGLSYSALALEWENEEILEDDFR